MSKNYSKFLCLLGQLFAAPVSPALPTPATGNRAARRRLAKGGS